MNQDSKTLTFLVWGWHPGTGSSLKPPPPRAFNQFCGQEHGWAWRMGTSRGTPSLSACQLRQQRSQPSQQVVSFSWVKELFSFLPQCSVLQPSCSWNTGDRRQQGPPGQVMYPEVTSRGRARLGNGHCRDYGESCGFQLNWEKEIHSGNNHHIYIYIPKQLLCSQYCAKCFRCTASFNPWSSTRRLL